MKRALMIALCLFPLGACGFSLRALSEAPPTKRGAVNEDNWTITLSKGIGLAVECWPNEEHGCDNMQFDVGDPDLVEILPAYLQPATGQGTQAWTAPTQKHVIVFLGKAAGTTDVFITTDEGRGNWTVVVTDR